MFFTSSDRCFLHQGSSPRRRSGRRQPSDETHKRGLNTKIHIAVDSSGMPVRVIVTDKTVADCSKASELIEGIDADCLLADRVYNTDTVIGQVKEAKMEAVIPPKKNRKVFPKDEEIARHSNHIREKSFLVHSRGTDLLHIHVVKYYLATLSKL